MNNHYLCVPNELKQDFIIIFINQINFSFNG